MSIREKINKKISRQTTETAGNSIKSTVALSIDDAIKLITPYSKVTNLHQFIVVCDTVVNAIKFEQVRIRVRLGSKNEFKATFFFFFYAIRYQETCSKTNLDK